MGGGVAQWGHRGGVIAVQRGLARRDEGHQLAGKFMDQLAQDILIVACCEARYAVLARNWVKE